MYKVRQSARPVFTYDWENDLQSDLVDRIKSEITRYLRLQGYKRMIYKITDVMETVAYVNEDVPFRNEPILLDDGGSVIPATAKRLEKIGRLSEDNELGLLGDRVLKIAIRDAYGKNKYLHFDILGIICQRIPLLETGEDRPVQPDTVVYALKRFIN